MRVITHRSIQKLDLAAAPFQFVDQQHLMDIVARQAIGCSDQEQLEGGKRSAITQAIQTRPVEFGPTISIITVNVLVGQMPVRLLGHMCPQAVKLLVDRLGLLLAAGRDAGIQCDFHGIAPSEMVMAPAGCQCQVPSPIAGGTGTHNPTVAHRHCGQSRFELPARDAWPSWYPPTSGRPMTQKDTMSVRITAGVARGVATTRGGGCSCEYSRICHL